MKRRTFLVLIGAAAAWPLAAPAQKPVPVVGFLSSRAAAESAHLVAGFREGLKEKEGGYVEGETVAIEYRWANNQYDRLPLLAAELVGRSVAVIVAAGGPPSALAAKTATGVTICEGTGAVRLGKLTWDFAVQPDALSRLYRVHIENRQGDVPQVWVVDPNLRELAQGRRLPHVYEQNPARLCLYLPGTGEWSPVQRISETIVPWTYLWLWYFEEWLASGVWKGGSQHPGGPGEGNPAPYVRGGYKCAAAR